MTARHAGSGDGPGALAQAEAESDAATAIRLLVQQGRTVGTAESLTGGLIAASLTSVPGASAVFLGGIVAYSAELKMSLLGVPGPLIDRAGTVDRDVALAMARGARQRLGVQFAIAVTGVAGPDPVGAQPAGTVHVAVSSQDQQWHRPLRLAGDRTRVRDDTVAYALRLLISALLEGNP
ncbi:MAG TPA: CinA family protein [Streptosporangiaceae bacterium]|nr:CinA family protein [Streptosporangiaceae bacterium]